MSTINQCAKQDTKEVKSSLKISMFEGVAAAGMLGFTQDYLTPCLLFLGGTAAHVGMLTAVPNLFTSLFQFKSADYTNHLKSRKRTISIFVLLQIFMLIVLTVSILFKLLSPFTFIILIVLIASLGGFAAPAWSSLISDLVADDKRGLFFGLRNKVVGLTLVGMSFIAGFLLQVFKGINLLYGFVTIFFIASIFRVISWNLLSKMHDVCTTETKDDHFTFYEFISRLKQSNFAKFVILVSLFNFSVYLSAPFFAVLMLENLSFSYITYTIVVLSATLPMYVTMQRWGRFADTAGNLKVIRITSFFISFVPVLWIINRNTVFLIFAQILSGFVWAGFNLTTSNFMYDAVSPAKRTRCISYFNFLNGIAICFGALLGGIMLKWLPPIFGTGILTLFLISSVLRFVVSFYFPKKLKEVRNVEKIRSIDLFLNVIGIKP
ncbi:MAG: MFS transporter [Elusimicrobia bacterium]|nr:MFS transporter [Candidatus Liberimonas magnetica]